MTPSTGKPFTEVARSSAEDVDLALDAAHAAREAWAEASLADRAAILNRIADLMEENLEQLAVAESYENGKPVRETLAADIPLAIDHSGTSLAPPDRWRAGRPRSTRTRLPTTSTNASASSARSSRSTSRF